MCTQPWGKFDAKARTRHHLAHHCADVAACFRRLVMLPAIRNRLHRAASCKLTDTQLERLTALVFLHDVGKLHPGFQSRGWPDENWGVQPRGHVSEGLEIFLANDGFNGLSIAEHLHIQTLGAWGIEPSLLRAVISHHGRPAPLDVPNLDAVKRYWRMGGSHDPLLAAEEIGRKMADWFPDAFAEGGAELPCGNGQFEHLVCGLTTLADWLGSSTTWFQHAEDLDENYIAKAHDLAKEACSAVGLDASRQRSDRNSFVTFEELTGFPTPNPQQALIGAIDLEAQIVILEAETGSGKTEAALWHYMRLFEEGRVDGLYFAVPTRAAAKQLHRRVDRAAKRVFPAADPQAVLAVPGYLKAGEIGGRALPDWQVLWDDAELTNNTVRQARWAAEHSKRYLAAQIAVGTIDQAMMGALTVKHAHLRAASLSRSLLVIDEVHASDAYMTLVQKRVLDDHVAAGGYAMLMSATLGSTARVKWLGHTGPGLDAACNIPYPAVWTSSSETPKEPAKSSGTPKRVEMELLTTMAPDSIAQRALIAARMGARVLVIRNTVDRAVETLRALETLVEPEDDGLLFRVRNVATLHHSRFAPTDRNLLDQAVEAVLTTDKQRAPEGRIVIGTQTLEQSLDIDADFLLTDLCPVDVLLQRIGRLHRHKLRRPFSFDVPRCVVMSPHDGLDPLIGTGLAVAAKRRAAPGLGTVYRDLSILELTRSLIRDHAVWAIPDMNRFLVEAATHPEAIEKLHEKLGLEWRKAHDDVRGGQLGEQLTALSVLIDRNKPFEQCSFPDGAEERIRTRLGDDTIRIALAEPLPTGLFGEPVTEIVLPGHWCRDFPVDGALAEHSQNENSVVISVGGAIFPYDRYGLARQGDRDDRAQFADGTDAPV
ncbi:MAG: CRISPR-associated helicase Cas3' [Pseudomonadota bacterium]